MKSCQSYLLISKWAYTECTQTHIIIPPFIGRRSVSCNTLPRQTIEDAPTLRRDDEQQIGSRCIPHLYPSTNGTGVLCLPR